MLCVCCDTQDRDRQHSPLRPSLHTRPVTSVLATKVSRAAGNADWRIDCTIGETAKHGHGLSLIEAVKLSVKLGRAARRPCGRAALPSPGRREARCPLRTGPRVIAQGGVEAPGVVDPMRVDARLVVATRGCDRPFSVYTPAPPHAWLSHAGPVRSAASSLSAAARAALRTARLRAALAQLDTH